MKCSCEYVIKRDGRIVSFDSDRIEVALKLAISSKNRNGASKQDICETLLPVILDTVDEKCSGGTITVEEIQDIVISTAQVCGYTELANDFDSYRRKRNRVRDKKSSLMKKISDISSCDSMSCDLKRENGNINGDSAMGTMLKFGSTTSKEYYLNNVIKKEQANAHISGDIHIHDLDFYGLTTTCVTRDTKIVLKVDDNVFSTNFGFFDYLFSSDSDELHYIDDVKILCGNEFVDVKWCSRRKVREDERVYNISTRFGSLSLTGEHKVPIIRDNEQVIEKACDIREGDSLLTTGKYVGKLTEINCINLFSNCDEIVIKNTQLLRKVAHEHKFITKFYSRLNLSGSHKYSKCITLSEYFKVRDLFNGIMDERCLVLGYKGDKSSGFPSHIKLTSDVGKFIGYIYSEGSIRSVGGCRSITFTNSNELMISDYSNIFKGIFENIDLRISEKLNHRCFDVTCSKAYISELFRGPFGFKEDSYNITLPIWIYDANDEFMCGFISGLIDGDGCIDKDFTSVKYSTSCKEYCESLHNLLSVKGISSTIQVRKFSGTVAQFDGRECVRKSDNYVLGIFGHFIDDLNLTKSILYNNRNKIVNRNLSRTNNNHVNCITVIDYDGFVYDIETSNHYFNANEFLIHNCTQIDVGKLLESGFSTGHGYLRPPSNIRTAASLACIVIQSNQNDQHK